MFCTQCGQQVELGRFCTNCGTPLAARTDAWRTDTSERGVAVEAEHTSAEHTSVLPAVATVSGELQRPAYAAPVAYPAPRRSRPRPPVWLWLVAAIVVVALIGWLLGRSTHDGTAADGHGAAASAGDLTRGATASAPVTAPPRQDVDGDLVPYVAGNLLDGVPSTTWRMAGDGTGTTLTVTLPAESVVTRVGLINGYAKVDDGTDWYPRNRRVLEVEWEFDDGSRVVQHLEQTPTMQGIDVGPVRTSTVRLRIMFVSAPGDRDYTAISDLLLQGSPA